MLEELTIRDFALIDRLQLKFTSGLNVLSGETGAGKSILIGALGFVLGDKPDASVIRSGAEETLVSGVFALGGNADAAAWLSERGIELEDGTVLLRRSLKTNGRGSIYIQSAPVTRADLQEFTSLLVDVHGQHEHQSLLASDKHRRFLDRFAGIEDEVAAYGKRFGLLCDKRKAFESMLASENDRARRVELLEYAVKEIEEAKLKEGEEEELDLEEKRLSQHEKLFEAIDSARRDLTAAGEGALVRLRQARQALESAAGIDEGLSPLSRRLDDAFYEIEDLADSLRSYMDSVHFSPERLDQVSSRIAEIHKLKKKYGADVAAVLAYLAQSSGELEQLQTFEQDRGAIEAEIQELQREVYRLAGEISAKRAAASSALGSRIVEIVRTLGMPKAGFSVSIQRKPDEGGKPVVGQYGFDLVEFLIAPNPGEPMKPLAKIASGGELSRVMLALKTALAESDYIGTMVFDEIDTGIGGEVGVAVGEHLSELSRSKQVFCITHLASIAAHADNHMMVEKVQEAGRSLTRVKAVRADERVREIARMLSGTQGGEASLAHAQELLNRFSRPGEKG
jgi:DNA repair protein RecN (Recombination protein N)